MKVTFRSGADNFAIEAAADNAGELWGEDSPPPLAAAALMAMEYFKTGKTIPTLTALYEVE